MRELRWLETHIGTLDRGIELINSLYWHLSVVQKDSIWLVRSGDQVVLRTDSRETVDAFIYGMALAYSILPHELIKQFVSELNNR